VIVNPPVFGPIVRITIHTDPFLGCVETSGPLISDSYKTGRMLRLTIDYDPLIAFSDLFDASVSSFPKRDPVITASVDPDLLIMQCHSSNWSIVHFSRCNFMVRTGFHSD
jgi:hypothetical protein